MNGQGATGADSPDTALMCSLHAGAGLFGIDTTQIREVLGSTDLRQVPLAPSYVDGVMSYRGEMLTTISLRALLGLERQRGDNCVLVLEDSTNGERFGLAVDGVGGVIAIAEHAVEPNPSALNERSVALFDGICRTEAGLMVRLDPRRLRPSRLAATGLFDDAKRDKNGERI